MAGATFPSTRRARAAVAVLLVALAAAGWWVWRTQMHGARDASAASEWLTATVERGDLEDVVMVTGQIRASRMVNVGSQATGQVRALHVKVGDVVRKGQPIAEIDATAQTNALQDEMAALQSIQAQKVARQVALEHARLALRRQQMMDAREATSKAELQAAENALAAALAEVKANESQLKQAHIKIATAQANLGYTRIVAPMDGTVVAVLTEQGQTLNAATASPTLVKLAKLDVVQIEAQISEADVARVKPGMKATFSLLGDPDRRYPTSVHAVDMVPTDQARDAGGGTGGTSQGQGAVYYTGILQAPNPDGKLRVAMTAQVSIIVARQPNALIVPAAALGAKVGSNRREVRVLVGEGKAARVETRAVRVGLNNRVEAQVLDGIPEGAKVIVGKATGAGGPGGGRGAEDDAMSPMDMPMPGGDEGGG